jgi:Lar family restriction alleviation protein
MSEPETQELKPCPFCGEDPVYLTDFENDDGNSPVVHHVSCGLCYVQPGIYGEESKEEAFRKWNTRVPVEPAQPSEDARDRLFLAITNCADDYQIKLSLAQKEALVNAIAEALTPVSPEKDVDQRVEEIKQRAIMLREREPLYYFGHLVADDIDYLLAALEKQK